VQAVKMSFLYAERRFSIVDRNLRFTDIQCFHIVGLALRNTSVRAIKDIPVTRRRFIQHLCAASAPTALFPHAWAQEAAWPLRAVKIVVPYAAGGSSDTLGRMVSLGLTDIFKQPFVIENKGGAGGVIGSQQVAKTAPDGYNLVISGIGSHVIAPAENPKAAHPSHWP
jgi:Tripartite tricarboxylate transporter family receptor